MTTQLSAPDVETETADPKPVGIVFIVIFALAMLGIWMTIMLPASVTVALLVAEIDPEGKTASYSIAAGLGGIVALLANSFFGRLSDNTRSRWGRRRPWIVIGLIGTAIGALVISFSDTFGLLLVGWLLMQAFINATVAAALAVIADRVPVFQQGLVGALSGMASAASLVIGVFFIELFPTNILAQFGIPVIFAFVFCGALLWLLRVDDSRDLEPATFGVAQFFSSFVIDPRKAPTSRSSWRPCFWPRAAGPSSLSIPSTSSKTASTWAAWTSHASLPCPT